ncbi:MAG: hypothetical protein JXR48_18055 [Candidatus Delongbacteria bacterium]|nr:hypothetical protein [Candidatus Delongbacteria bacterium]MBN2836864.1 hypothetical protein [Candidatus Delongbacteria bacterium]
MNLFSNDDFSIFATTKLGYNFVQVISRSLDQLDEKSGGLYYSIGSYIKFNKNWLIDINLNQSNNSFKEKSENNKYLTSYYRYTKLSISFGRIFEF